MNRHELYLPATAKETRRTAGIEWTDGMLATIKRKFATSYNKELAEELGVGWRTLVRKARELGLEKEDGFLEKRREEIKQMAKESLPENPHKGKKGFVIPNSEKHSFKKGHTPATKYNAALVERIRTKRNATIREERWRLSIGLKQKTKLNLKAY